MTRLILVRHGETEWNSIKKLQGQADIALSKRGRDQAQAIAPLAQSMAPDAVIISNLARARETAAILGYPMADPLPAWREADLGEWTGMAVSDIVARWPTDYQAWRDGRLDPPGGENRRQFRQRIDNAIRRLPMGRDRILVVTHGGVIRAALAILIGLESDKIIPVDNGTITIFELGNTPRLRAYNLGAANGYESSD